MDHLLQVLLYDTHKRVYQISCDSKGFGRFSVCLKHATFEMVTSLALSGSWGRSYLADLNKTPGFIDKSQLVLPRYVLGLPGPEIT